MIAEFLGAVGKRFFYRDDVGRWVEWFWVAWWPVGRHACEGPQVRRVRRVGFFVGVRDWTRGRHWDRRHRYGVK